jgi:hypothetical protein
MTTQSRPFSSYIHRLSSPVPEQRSSRHVSHIESSRPIISCYRERPCPGRRKPHEPRLSQRSDGRGYTAWRLNFNILTVFFVVAMFLNGVSADERVHPALQKLARRGELLFDHSPQPERPSIQHLMERDKSTSNAPSATLTLVTATGHGSAAVATVDTTPPKSTSLPQPFDTTIGSNFTSGSGCPKFFNFLSDPQFQQCYPFSLLLQVWLPII